MENLVLQYIKPSDPIAVLVEKTNYNNDQIMQFGGGRIGPPGPPGIPAPPGATGEQGDTGERGERGSQIWSSQSTLANGGNYVNASANLSDWVIDAAGNYFILIAGAYPLTLSFIFNLVSVSGDVFLQTQTTFNTGGQALNWYRWIDDGTVQDRNIVFAKRVTGSVTGPTNDMAEFYRLMIGTNISSAENSSLSICNIIPDVNGLSSGAPPTLASGAQFYQIALKYRQSSTSLLSLNAGYISYNESVVGGDNTGYLKLTNSNTGLAIINDLISGAATVSSMCDAYYIGSSDTTNYLNPTNYIKFAVTVNTAAITMAANTTFSSTILANSLTISSIDGLSAGTSASLNLAVPTNINSSLTLNAVFLTCLASSYNVINLNYPNGTSLGTLSALYNYTSGSGSYISSIVGGKYGMIINIIIVDNVGLLLLTGSGIELANGSYGDAIYIPKGEVLSLMCVSGYGNEWKEIARSQSQFSSVIGAINVLGTPPDFNNYISPGFTVIGAPGAPSNSSPATSIATSIGHINFVEKQTPYDGTTDIAQQIQFVETGSNDSAPTSGYNKINPIFTRRVNKANSFETLWSKLLSEYGGNDIHDFQNFFGAVKFKPTRVAITTSGANYYQSINGGTPTTCTAFNVPSSSVVADDSSSSFYNISLSFNGGSVTNGFEINLPLIPNNDYETGRIVWLNIAAAPTTLSDWFVGVKTGGTTMNGISPSGSYDYTTNAAAQKSLLLCFMAVPSSDPTSTQLYKWSLFWSSETDNNSRYPPASPIW